MIFGAVFDESMGEDLRVTMVATGLGMPSQARQPKPLTIVKTGTDSMGHDMVYAETDGPAVIRSGRRAAAVEAMKASGVDLLDIPAFLRKQAD